MGCPSEEIHSITPNPAPVEPIPPDQMPINQSPMGAGPGVGVITTAYTDNPAYGGQSSVYPPDNQPISLCDIEGSPPVGGSPIQGLGSPHEEPKEYGKKPCPDTGFTGGENAPAPSSYTDGDNNTRLGTLSKRYESNGDPTIIGYDSTGGYSYGEYQIATKTGTFNNYMSYLQAKAPALHAELQAAGGNSAATSGVATFKSKWKQTMQVPANVETQHNFMQVSHYNPAVSKIKASTGIDVNARSRALQDTIWSTSVQHGAGGANTIAQRAINRAGRPASQITDADWISAIYDERGADNGAKYFPRSNANVRASVVNRFRKEKQDALGML